MSQLDPVQIAAINRVARQEARRITLRPEEAAEMLGVSRAFVYELIRTGKLRARKLGRRTIVMPDDVRKFIRKLPVCHVKA